MLDEKKHLLVEQFASHYVDGENYSDALFQLSQLYRNPRDFEWKWRKFLLRNIENSENAKEFLNQLKNNIVEILRGPLIQDPPVKLQCIPCEHSLKNLTSLLRQLGFHEDGRLNTSGNTEVTLRKLHVIFAELFIFLSIFSDTYQEIGYSDDSESEDEEEPEETSHPIPNLDARCYVCDNVADVFCIDCKRDSTLEYFCDECDPDYHCENQYISHVRRRIVREPPKRKCRKCSAEYPKGSSHNCTKPKTDPSSVWALRLSHSEISTLWICSSCYSTNRSNFVFCQSCGSDHETSAPSSFPSIPDSPATFSNVVSLVSTLNKRRVKKYPYKTAVCVSRQLCENFSRIVTDEEIETWLNEFINTMAEWGDSPNIFWKVEDIVAYIEGRDSERVSCDRDQLANLAMQHILNKRDSIVSIAQSHSERQIIDNLEEFGLNREVLFEQLNNSTCRDLPLGEEAQLTLDALVDAIVRTTKHNLNAAQVLAMSEFMLPNPSVATICIELLQLDELREILGTCRLTYENFFSVIKRTPSIENAKNRLLQECVLCGYCCSRENLCSFMTCDCDICSHCFIQWIEFIVRNKPPTSWACPICSEPNLDNVFTQGNEALVAEKEKEFDTHFMNLTMIIHNRFHLRELRNLFTSKLTAWRLSKEENFLWCAHGCGNGVIYLGGQKSALCDSCNRSTCKDCKKIWEPEHEGRTCEQFEAWKILQDPHIARLMQLSGIVCPKCHMRYELVRGGCLHFTCHQCKFEFCGGCNQPIYTKDGCPNECKGLGLHAHHPRDCLFFLRDWTVENLEKLLSNNKVAVNPAVEGLKKCPVKQSESLDEGEQACGKNCLKADLCEKHYKEYLVNLINRNHLDPAPLMETQSLLQCLTRAKLPLLVKTAQENAEVFRQRVIQNIQTQLPIQGAA